jgi:hypothetical protein
MLVPFDPARSGLRWTQPDTHQRLFELRDGERVHAHLRIERHAGTLATGETATGCWTFKRVGFMSPRVTARIQGFSEDAGVFTPAWGGGGAFVLAGGRSMRWSPGALFGPSAHLVRPDGLILAIFHAAGHGLSVRDLLRTEADVEILHAAWHEPDLPLLLVWAWYLTILARHDEASMVPGTAAGRAG